MLKFLRKSVMAAAMALGLFTAAAFGATYTMTLLADGTNLWTLVSSNSSAVSQMSLYNGTTKVLTFDPVNGAMLQVSLVSALPTCTSGLAGAVRVVSDGNSATTGGTLAGSGSYYVLAVCSGANWIVN